MGEKRKKKRKAVEEEEKKVGFKENETKKRGRQRE